MPDHVIFQAEVRVIDPLRVGQIEGHEGDLLAQTGHAMNARGVVVEQFLVGGRTVEQGEDGTVHRSTGCFRVKKRCIVTGKTHR